MRQENLWMKMVRKHCSEQIGGFLEFQELRSADTKLVAVVRLQLFSEKSFDWSCQN